VPGESLLVRSGPAAGQEIQLGDEFLIGRGADQQGTLGGDEELSRSHARVGRGADGELVVEDLGSTNGTYVNGTRLDAPATLSPGDVVRVGASELEFAVPATAGQATAARAAPPVSGTVLLRITVGPALGQEVRFAEELVIGRGAEAGGSLGGDPELSRRHARISRDADSQLVVEDLGSTNGTFVNGAQISAPVLLSPGDVIQVGASQVHVADIPAPATAPMAPAPVQEAAPAPAAAPLPPNGIEVEGLVRDFKGKGRAVNGIHLQVEPGEIYGFLGPNGAGKSTTVHMLTTLLPPTEGTARVAGYDIVRDGPRVRSTIGVALQEAALDPVLTGWQHMALQTALQGIPKAERKPRSEELIERVGLTDAADRATGGYSGGMRRRLDLALSLVHRPRVVFLDEPTTGLDPQSRSDLWDEVARLARDEGVTIFLTTQYLEEADVLAERVGIIEGGNIVAEGTPAELKAEIGRPTVEVVPTNDADRARVSSVLSRFGEHSGAGHKGVSVRLNAGVDDLADIVRALDAEGISVRNLALHAPTLDDVFLAKTGRSLEESVEETEAQQQASRSQISLPGSPIMQHQQPQ
jgi:ABC-2 type transport system ATP-binding protein